uniref:Uncharacterized protein n=1 Tax=Glossina austeni TaxID=7395 RepID=A0A1A9VBJ0_GLOAU
MLAQRLTTSEWCVMLTRGSCFMRLTNIFAMYGISRDIAPGSATLNLHKLSFKLYPYKLGLNCFRILGRVKNCCKSPSPPPDQDFPRFSVETCKIVVAKIPLPAVNESPIAPIISISPGRKRSSLISNKSIWHPIAYGILLQTSSARIRDKWKKYYNEYESCNDNFEDATLHNQPHSTICHYNPSYLLTILEMEKKMSKVVMMDDCRVQVLELAAW